MPNMKRTSKASAASTGQPATAVATGASRPADSAASCRRASPDHAHADGDSSVGPSPTPTVAAGASGAIGFALPTSRLPSPGAIHPPCAECQSLRDKVVELSCQAYVMMARERVMLAHEQRDTDTIQRLRALLEDCERQLEPETCCGRFKAVAVSLWALVWPPAAAAAAAAAMTKKNA